MYQYINDNFLHAPSQDLHKDTVKLLMELMLVQAQECFLENSLREKKKDSLVAKLASHTTWIYGNLVDQINDAISRGVGIAKTWLILCQCKQKYYQAVSQLHRAAACLSDAHYGEQVARLQWAERLAKDGQKLALQLPQQSTQQQQQQQLQWNNTAATFIGFSSNNAGGGGGNTSQQGGYNMAGASPFPHDGGSCLNDLCTSLAALCLENFTMAERDNDMIYHDQVPQESILVPIDRLKAVKAIPISDLYGATDAGKVVGPDIFTRLIPLSVHESASLYSEEKASLVRRELERCDFAKAEMNASLDYMKLPGALDKFKNSTHGGSQWNSGSSGGNLLWDRFASPPTEVKKWATDIQSNELRGDDSSIQHIVDEIQNLAHNNKSTLDQISLQLDTEMGACESMRVKYGDDWTQAPSGTLSKDYRQDVRNHRDTLKNAQLSDTQVMQKLESISKEIAILKQGPSSEALEALFTDISAHLLTDLPSDSSSTTSVMDLQIDVGLGNNSMRQKVKRVEAILDKLNKLQNDRDNTIEDLKEKTKKDDIMQLLILNKKNSNVERQIFSAQLEKYQSHQQRITAAIHHQQQVIQELSTAFKDLMDMEEAQKLQLQWDNAERQHTALVKKLNGAFTGYNEVKDALRNGTNFYTELSQVVDSLLKNVDYFVADRKEERDTLIDQIEGTRSAHEQRALKDRLEQYESPRQQQQQQQQSDTGVHPAITSTTTEETGETLRDQLEQKMKDLSITTQSYTSTSVPVESSSSSLTPTSSYNVMNSNNNNNHVPSPIVNQSPSHFYSTQNAHQIPPNSQYMQQQQQQQHYQPPPITPTSYQGNVTPLPNLHQRQTSYDQCQTPSSLPPFSPTPSAMANQSQINVMPSSLPPPGLQQQHQQLSGTMPTINHSRPPYQQQQQPQPLYQQPYQQQPQQQQDQKPMLPPKPQEVQRAMMSMNSAPLPSPSSHYGYPQQQQQQQPIYSMSSQMTPQQTHQQGPSANATSYLPQVSTPTMMQPPPQHQMYMSSATSSPLYPSQGNNYVGQQQQQQQPQQQQLQQQQYQQQPVYTATQGNHWNQAPQLQHHHQQQPPPQVLQQQQQHQQQQWAPLEPQPYSVSNNQPSLLD
ncbi:unnamed protein product [Absidia cylindrospora]